MAKCEELRSADYFELERDNEEDADYIKMLRILVPERVVELNIER